MIPTAARAIPIGNFETADFSIAFWFKTTQVYRTQWILSKRPFCSHGNFFNLSINSSGQLLFEMDEDSDGSNYGNVAGSATVTDDAWHHVAFVRQETSMNIYLDGGLDAMTTTADTTNLSNMTDLLVGEIACAGGQNYGGEIDELAIWVGYALSLSEEGQLACARHP